MPVLANARQELYAKHRANGFVAKKAAQAAGYATGSAIYQGLEEDPEIIARIQELMDERAEAKAARMAAAQAKALAEGHTVGTITGVSHAWVIEQLKMNAEDAREAGDFKESNASLKLIGEAMGMWTGSGNDGGPGGSFNPNGGEGAMQLIDLDAIGQLVQVTDQFHAKLEGPTEVSVDQRDTAMMLIAGQGTKSLAPQREMSTGSETDAALQMLDALDENLLELAREVPPPAPEILD
ncbi:putative terminase small subunit [Caulobacter phage BL47]|nr:putative terminase small subunit [Caulobacter phage BL47]UTU10353.1 putative terminase small subunit [Caulobacter phage RB23]